MARRCIQMSNQNRLATAYYGGHDRGKIVQLHMMPQDLERYLGCTVYDDDTRLLSTIDEWLTVECANANMVIFDAYAEEKVSTMLVEKIR